MPSPTDVQERFQAALETLIEKAQQDRYIIAAVLFGSLSYDTVWEKSDIDLIFITTENLKTPKEEEFARSFALTELDVNIHVGLQSRSDFKKSIEGSVQGAFFHSAFTRSRLLFSRDDSIAELYDNALRLGERDRQVQLLRAGTNVLPALYKAEKFCTIKKDPHYSYMWVAQTYTPLAQIESFIHGEIPDREVLRRAVELNPQFFGPIYIELADKKKTLKNIAEVLDMSIEEGVAFFAQHPAIARKIDVLDQLGLGYLTLGQSSTTLSGGEAQRIKLASELSKLRRGGHTLYILDEPTTGLHLADIARLLDCLNRLVDAGHTVVVIEHHLDVIKTADHVIDLGPEGGHSGGEVIAAGPPEAICKVKRSYTGHFLKDHL